MGAEEIAAELGGLSPAKRHAAELAADALHRALGRGARERARLAPCADAHARGDERRRGQRGGRAARRARTARSGGGDARAVVRPRERRRAQLLLGAGRARRARALAHRMGLPHLSIDLREEFRAGVVDGWLEDHAAGLTPNPCVRCNGQCAARRDARARRRAWGAHARHRPLRAGRARGEPLLRVAADAAKDQSYCSPALAPRRSPACASRSASSPSREVRERAARAGLAVARRPDSQDLCFLAGTDRADVPGAPRRPRKARGRDRRSRGARAGRARGRAHRHRRPAPRPRDRRPCRGGEVAAVRARHRRARQHRHRRAARAVAHDRVSVRDVDAAPRRRLRGPPEAALPRAPCCRAVRSARAPRARARHASRCERRSRSAACLMPATVVGPARSRLPVSAGEAIVGHGDDRLTQRRWRTP